MSDANAYLNVPLYYKEHLKPEELAEWAMAQSEIDRLTDRIKLLQRRADGRAYRGPGKREIAKLRTAMVAAHPDKGGSHDAFIAASNAYQRALRESK
jgi:uncharacterized protein YcgI (DUF1989 family)